MNINRHNYEEFFLLYADNELSAAEKQAVDQFVLQNSDLGEELQILMQLRLSPDENIRFEQKEILYQAEFEYSNGITETNYEGYLLSYIDNELGSEERKAVEKFLERHPSAKQELEILQKAKLLVDNSLVFPDKSLLYRTAEEPARIIQMKWWKVAVAAGVIIVAGLFWFNNSNNNIIEPGNVVAKLDENKANNSSTKKNSSGDVVTKTDDARNTNGTSDNADEKAGDGSKGTRQIKEETESQQSIASVQEPTRTRVNKKEMKPEENTKTSAIEKIGETKSIVAIEPNNSLPVPEVITSIDTKSTAIPTAKNIIDKPALSEEVKTNYASEALLREDYQVDVARAEEPEPRKGLFRGLVRKANRVLNKVTNPDPKKSSVRVAGFEIALAK